MHIKQLKLYTSHLKEQIEFYTQVLNIEVIEQTPTSVFLQLGNSILHFESKPDATPYHFAINIPAYKETAALEWLKNRVEVLKHGEQEIQNFDSWNARAIYFYDADKNIVEFISRRNLNQESKATFSSESLLEISEIGMVVNNIESCFKDINKQMNLSVYAGDFTEFCAIGGEHGLFICIVQKRDWFPQNDFANVSDLELEVIFEGKNHCLQFINGQIHYINC